ncbi:MAG: 3-isopropylmalate dehydrogenase [Actinomycetota bacterium]|nr:3-isopropylmalate dehydrogenase [Actinomycetota bacterium]MDA3012932.1 3-isopropylmalate dehydrogenase [Actinomycetota bacterium]
MKKEYKISLLPGDGTGPEVVAEAVKVLEKSSSKYNIVFKFSDNDLGGERFLKTNELVTKKDIDELQNSDAILLGAIGHPDVKPGILEQGILLKLRKEFDQYINLRPVVLYPGIETPLSGKSPEDINFTVVRENTEGLYAGAGGYIHYGTKQEVATQESINTYYAIHRCIKYAFDYATKFNRKKVTLCAKTNVLTFAHDLWERIFYDVAKDYPNIETDYGHVDAVCMWMVKNPEWFDVIVTDNMFGDIITDLGAMIQGGMGIAAGGNINPNGISMFEPIGGSAPKYTNKNVINPLACIAAAGMMASELGEENYANDIESAIIATAQKLNSLSAGKMGMSTTEVGDTVLNHLLNI